MCTDTPTQFGLQTIMKNLPVLYAPIDTAELNFSCKTLPYKMPENYKLSTDQYEVDFLFLGKDLNKDFSFLFNVIHFVI